MKLFLVCEGPADELDLRTLVRRTLHGHHEWMRGLDHPEWYEHGAHQKLFFAWRDIGERCDALDVPRVHGRYGGWYRQATRVLRLSARMDASRVLLVHDSDGSDEVEVELKQARSDWLEKIRPTQTVDVDVAVGVAHPEHEAWALAAFEPQNEEEHARLASERQRLGFDPTLHGHRLTPGRETAPKDAKQALLALCEGERRRALLEAVDLGALRKRGQHVGLVAFLDEIDERIAPAFGHVKK